MGLLKVSGVNEKMVDDKVIHIIHRKKKKKKPNPPKNSDDDDVGKQKQ